METDILGEMLHFIYTGVVHDHVLKEKAGYLLAAAESYQLDVLKKICSLCAMLGIVNSILFLVLGDMYLTQKFRRMLAMNMNKLVFTEEFQNLVYNHPALVLELSKAVEENNE